MDNDPYILRLLKYFAIWMVTCYVCAIPSFLWAVDEFDIGAMILGVFIFVLIYTFVCSAAWFGNFRRICGMKATLFIGYGTRVVMSLLFPLGMAVDLIPGMYSIFLAERIIDNVYPGSYSPFIETLTVTLIQGTFINLLLAGYMAVIFPVARILSSKKKTMAEQGLCEGCGYDLRASEGHCPECGLVIPAGPRPRILIPAGEAKN